MKPFLLLALFCSAQLAFGQAKDTSAIDPYDMSLEQLMNIKVTSTKTNLSSRETPSIVSVITREDIKNMGARDLMDVLNQVPGFSFGADVQNTVGIGSRGNWGHEGKILLLIDGNEMNEILYATTQFGQHYNISNVDRIEIIRGPGSSIYGGYAELGVINIITRTGQQMKSASMGAMYGGVSGGTARQNIRFNIGNGTDKVNYAFSGLYGEGTRSTKDYSDFSGNTTNLKSNAGLRPMMFNGTLNAGQFSASMIYDGYYQKTVDQLTDIQYAKRGGSDSADIVRYNTFFTSLKYNANINSKLTITPRFNFKSGTPWKALNESPIAPIYQVSATRLAPGINATFNPNDKVNLVFGADSYFDFAKYTANDPSITPSSPYFSSLNKGNSITFHNIGAFVQGVFRTDFANFTLGARVDDHSQFGSAFSPRLGITKAWDKFHVKALYSRAFRSPAIENIHYNPSIKPEKTGVAELELGYKLNDNMFLTGNGFYIQITDPIVYTVVSGSQTYTNATQAGSVGFEIDYRIKYNWGYVSSNYSTYSARTINKVADYNSLYNPDAVLSLPTGRFNFNANIKLSDVFSINPTVSALSKRYGVTGANATSYKYSAINSQVLANIYFRAKTSNWDAGIGVYNITDENQVYIQAYSGGHAPLPGLGREFLVNLQYTIPLK